MKYRKNPKRTFCAFGEGRSAPSFAPDANAERTKGLFFFHIDIPANLAYTSLTVPFVPIHIAPMGQRKKHRELENAERRKAKIKRDKEKLKRLKKTSFSA